MTATIKAERVGVSGPRVRHGRRRARNLRPMATSLAFAAPALLVYVAFLVYPAIYSIRLSFTDWDGLSPVKKFVGLGNYTKLLHDPVVHTAVRNNLIWAFVTVIVPIALGLGLAIAVNSRIYLRPLIRTIFYTPAVLPLVGVGTIWEIGRAHV